MSLLSLQPPQPVKLTTKDASTSTTEDALQIPAIPAIPAITAIPAIRKVSLKRFDMSTIVPRAHVVIIGKRQTGKSTLVKDIVSRLSERPDHSNHFKSSNTLIVDPTSSSRKEYAEIAPPESIHTEYAPELIEDLVSQQRSGHCQPWQQDAIVVLDACFYDNSWMRDVNIRDMLISREALAITPIIAHQFAPSVPHSLRSQIDYVFVFRENVLNNRKRIYDNYATSAFDTFETFCNVLDTTTTENYECLVMDLRPSSKGNKLEDQVFWYKTII